jgi:hypothetical protein
MNASVERRLGALSAHFSAIDPIISTGEAAGVGGAGLCVACCSANRTATDRDLLLMDGQVIHSLRLMHIYHQADL